MIDKSADLQQLLLLSYEMLERAQSASWDELYLLEEKRRELFDAFFLSSFQVELHQVVSDGIESILAIDQIIIELGRAEMLNLEESLMQLDRGKKAVKAYDL